MKAVQLLVESSLPEDLRDPSREYSAKGLGQLLTSVATRYPERYEEIAKTLSDIGLQASYNQGETLRLRDMKPVIDRDAILGRMDVELKQARKAALDDRDYHRLRQDIWQRYSDVLQKDTMAAALQQGNNLGYTILSGARGKVPQLQMMVTSPGLYQDSEGEVVPLFIRRSFGEGLRPTEFMAGSYGARSTVISTKRATAKGGYLSKLAVQAATPQMVTEKDCGTDNGLDLDLDDDSLRHRALARAAGGFPAGTILDRAAIARLRKNKVDKVITRSAMTCQARDGVCSRCLGADPKGNPYPIGFAAGITAAQATFEPVTQNALNAKHQGGMVAGGRRQYSGFNWLNQFVQAPEEFPDKAVLAEQDGKVDRVEEAPQGGQYVVVGDSRHYVPAGFELNVKPGDAVEQGDQLSDGLINPADVVRLRGLGEGRRYYANRLKQILDDSGLRADRRNTEILARAGVNHLNIDELDDPTGALPDDVVAYDRYARDYTPPETAQERDTQQAVGQILQRPALHYSIGTRLTPKMADRLKTAGFSKVLVDTKGPPVTPTMIRLQSAMHNSDDWLASQHTSYLKRQLSDAATRGQDTNIESNVHFVPRLAFGERFGERTYETGKF